MLSFDELVTKLRRRKVVRYEELIVASVIKVTKIHTTWSLLRKQYRHDPSAWYTLERRMLSMVPVRYHDSIKQPRSDTKELLKKTRRALRKKKRIALGIIRRMNMPVIVDDDFVVSNLEIARQRAHEYRGKRNKINRHLNVVQRKENRKLRYVKALITIAIAKDATDKRRRRKLAPALLALISQPPPTRRWLSKATEVKLEELVSRAGEKDRAAELKAKEDEVRGSKTREEYYQLSAGLTELAYWERFMKSKMQWKFAVGQRVRRDRKVWPQNRPVFFGTIVSQEVGSDNNGRQKPGYKVQWDRSESGPSSFLEIELEETKSRRKK